MAKEKSEEVDPLIEAGSIDTGSSIPLYAQVKDCVGGLIERGRLVPGQQLPGEHELCRHFGVSRPVIRQAIQDLVYAGRLVRLRGKGTFVAEPKISEGLVQRLVGFHQDMRDHGRETISRVLRFGVVSAPSHVARMMGIRPRQKVILLDRLRYVLDEPIVLVSTYLPYPLCEPLLKEDLSRQSLYMVLGRKYGLTIARGRRTIEAVPANPEQSRLLQIKPGTPLLSLESISYLPDGRPLEYYYALHRADRSRFEVELVRLKAEAPGEPSDCEQYLDALVSPLDS